MSQVKSAYSNAERQIIGLFDRGHESESWGRLKLFCHRPPAIIVIQHQDSDFAVEVMIRAQKSEYKFYSSWARGGSKLDCGLMKDNVLLSKGKSANFEGFILPLLGGIKNDPVKPIEYSETAQRLLLGFITAATEHATSGADTNLHRAIGEG